MLRRGSFWITAGFITVICGMGLFSYAYWKFEIEKEKYNYLLEQSFSTLSGSQINLLRGDPLLPYVDRNSQFNVRLFHSLKGGLKKLSSYEKELVSLHKKIIAEQNKYKRSYHKGKSSIESVNDDIRDILPLSNEDKKLAKTKDKIKLMDEVIELLNKLKVVFQNIVYELYKLKGNIVANNDFKRDFTSLKELNSITKQIQAKLPLTFAQEEKQIEQMTKDITQKLLEFWEVKKDALDTSHKVVEVLQKEKERLSELSKKKDDDLSAEQVIAEVVNSFPDQMWFFLDGTILLIFLLIILINIRQKHVTDSVIQRNLKSLENHFLVKLNDKVLYNSEIKGILKEIYEECAKNEDLMDEWIIEAGKSSENYPMQYPLQAQKVLNKIRLTLSMIMKFNEMSESIAPVMEELDRFGKQNLSEKDGKKKPVIKIKSD